MTTKNFIVTSFNKIIILFFVISFFILLSLLILGCANTSYHTIPSGMREDSQDYNTKYNMMDSPDGRRNPNAQVRIFGATY